MLRCAQLGLHTQDLEQMTMGMVYDMFTEQENDSEKYPTLATQEDFDNF